MTTQQPTACPICDYAPQNYGQPNKDRNKEVRHHITVKAKNELWVKEFEPCVQTPHLDYFRKHMTKIVKVTYKIEMGKGGDKI